MKKLESIPTENSRPEDADYLMDHMLKLFPTLTARPDHDRIYLAALISEFGDKLDIGSELYQFHAWCLDQPLDRKISIRSRFRMWLKTAVQFQRPAIMRSYIIQNQTQA